MSLSIIHRKHRKLANGWVKEKGQAKVFGQKPDSQEARITRLSGGLVAR